MGMDAPLWPSTFSTTSTATPCTSPSELSLSLAKLAPSLLHMHANRLLRSDQRRQEMVLYLEIPFAEGRRTTVSAGRCPQSNSSQSRRPRRARLERG